MSGAGEKNKASASSYSKASTVQIELQPEVVQETTGNGYHRFAGAQPGDGGLVANPSADVPGGGYITPAQAGAGGLNSTQASPLRSLSPPSNVAPVVYLEKLITLATDCFCLQTGEQHEATIIKRKEMQEIITSQYCF